MTKFTTSLILALMLLLPSTAFAQETIVVTDDDVVGDTHWTSDNTYILDGRVFVEEGGTLTIDAGTVIKGRYSADPNNASVLVVAPGAKIFAEGTPELPIIFTAEADDLNDPTDLTADDKGLWGGVIILGRAGLNVAGNRSQIEGIPEDDTRGTYGGDDDDDDSGVFRYVSIRHGGTSIAPNNEINGLTMGGVGRGTTIEYVEVFANMDDGFEWFGGTVDTRYLISAFAGDDQFDYDEGYRGRGQFWFGIQGADDAGSGGEFDGGTTPEDGQPYAIPTIYNATLIGSGADANLGSNDFALNIRDNAGGKIHNSIFTDFSGTAVQVEDLPSGEDSWARLLAGDLAITHNIFYGFGDGSEASDLFVVAGEQSTHPQFVEYMTAAAQANRIVDPALKGISRGSDGGLDPRPAPDSPALSGATDVPDDGFFVPTSFVGALGADDTWIAGWTALDELGHISIETGTSSESGPELPRTVTLHQNYPNPFNPATSITFEIAKTQRIRLSVVDVMGREVAVLTDGTVPVGSHTVSFDAASLASGLYIYRLDSAQGSTARTMTVLK